MRETACNIFMEKDKTELESFMGELGNAGNADPMNAQQEDPFAGLEKKPEEVIDEEEKEEKPLPFNKDPKIQKFIEKEISKRLENFRPETPQAKQEEDSFKETIDAFTAIIGNDTPEKVNALNTLAKSLNSLDQRASSRAIAELENIRNEEVQADQEAEQELEDAFENIEETFDVDITSNNAIAKKTRQEFVSFVEKIAPKDENGEVREYPDFNSAWETFSEMKKSTAQPNRAKDLASRSMRQSVETKEQVATPTRSSTPFGNSEAFIESLSG